MKKRFAIILCTCLILTSMSNISTVAESSTNEITREEVETIKPAISKREATISMLLNAGWTMEDIKEWYTEDALLELDENVLGISETVRYTANHEDAESGEVQSKELTRQEFDYHVNRVKCAEEPDTTELNIISSNGILELQPIYGWQDAENKYPSGSGLHYDYQSGGYSGSSVWHNDSSCYLKQNMGLLWVGNARYTVQYRFEWMTTPLYRLNDYFAVGLATDMIVHNNPNASFVYKYTLVGDAVETLTTSSPNGTFSSMTPLSFGQGRKIKVTWPYVNAMGSGHLYGTNVRGFLSFDALVNNKNTYDIFIAYAQFYHQKIAWDPSISIGFDADGVSGSFSITPSNYHTAETHPMEVRAHSFYS